MTHPSPSELEQTFGQFFGSSLDENTCEILAIANIDRKTLDMESRLYRHKWFDYRTVHPTMATYLFAHHYNRAYGDIMGKCYDRSKRFMAAFKGKDVMACREVKSFWRLRQKADELGMRYDFFCREAMLWCTENGWKQPPRPAHVGSNNDLLIHASNMWELECRAKIQWSRSPRFTTSAFVGSPDQLAYEDQLAARIMQKAHPKFSLHAALYLHDAIRIEAALSRFPLTAINDAISLAQVCK